MLEATLGLLERVEGLTSLRVNQNKTPFGTDNRERMDELIDSVAMLYSKVQSLASGETLPAKNDDNLQLLTLTVQSFLERLKREAEDN